MDEAIVLEDDNFNRCLEYGTNNPELKYIVKRPVFSQSQVDKTHEELNNASPLSNCFRKLPHYFSWQRIINRLFSFIPFITILKSFYKKQYLLMDLIAGVTMTVLHIPQGMAYGLLAGLEPINGLYTSFYPQLTYFFLGTSRHLSVGTFSLISLITADSVDRLAVPGMNQTAFLNTTGSEGNYLIDENNNDMANRVLVAISLTLATGLIQILMGLFRLGFVVNYLSDALVGGFTSAAAFHVIASQLNKVFGFSMPRVSSVGKLILYMIDFMKRISTTNFYVLAISLVCMVLLVVVREFLNPIFKKKFFFPFPIELILVAFTTLISYLGDFHESFGVPIVGSVPPGLAKPIVPPLEYFPHLLGDATVLALVTFCLSASISKIYAIKNNYHVNYNQELIALGGANAVSSFFQCHVSAGALARTAVSADVGMTSQIASLISSMLMLFVLLFIGPLFHHVPQCVLSSIIIVSLKGIIMQIADLKKLWKTSYFDFAIWLVTFLATILLDVTLGLVVGFIFSLLTILYRSHVQTSMILGYIPRTEIYQNIQTCQQAVEVPHIKIFRFEGSLYFANADAFRKSLYRQIGVNPAKKKAASTKNLNTESLQKEESVSPIPSNHHDGVEKALLSEPIVPNCVHTIVIDCSAWSYIDLCAVNVLKEVMLSYQKVGIRVYLAQCESNIRQMLTDCNFKENVQNDFLYPSVHDAVLAALRETVNLSCALP